MSELITCQRLQASDGQSKVAVGLHSRTGNAAESSANFQAPTDSAIAPDVYDILAQHQRHEEWNRRELMADLQTWANRFVVEFKLDIPEVVLCVDVLPSSRYGHFRYGHNGFGLKGEIALNARYLTPNVPKWEVLGTLAHELLHAWQQAHGTPGKRNYHNSEFREKAIELGLVVDRRGVTGYTADSPFKNLLRHFGVVVPEHEVLPPGRRQPGQSKLKKWSCGCTNVRVAVADFRARCLKCGRDFSRDDRGVRKLEPQSGGPSVESKPSDDGCDIEQWETDGGAVSDAA